VGEELGAGVVQQRAILNVVIADFVAGGFYLGDKFRMTQGALTNQEECCVGVVLLEDGKDLRCEDRVRSVIKGKCDHGTIGANAVSEVGSNSLEDGDGGQWLDCEE